MIFDNVRVTKYLNEMRGSHVSHVRKAYMKYVTNIIFHGIKMKLFHTATHYACYASNIYLDKIVVVGKLSKSQI